MSHKQGCCGGDNISIDTQPSALPLVQSPFDASAVSYPVMTPEHCNTDCNTAIPIVPTCQPVNVTQTPTCAPTYVPMCPSPVPQTCPPYRPHYQAALCPTESKQTVWVEKLVGSFKNTAAFAMPACDAKLKVVFDKVGDMPIGAWLWSFGIGYLTITGFNVLTGEVELRNDCPDTLCPGQTQAAPGTPIPACSVFVLQAPLCTGAGQSSILNFPYVNSGFVAPANGACVDIAVTNTNGLSVNAVIAISSGEYRVGAIISGTLINICNDGGGLSPGTVVDHDDSAGNLLLPISLIQSNQCLNTAVTTGAMLVCKNGTQQPLTGGQTGQIPVYNHSTGEVALTTLDIPTLGCTSLTVGLTINPLNPPTTNYIATVGSSAGFIAGQRVTIGGSRFLIENIPAGGVYLEVMPEFPFVDIVGWGEGTAVCDLRCCDELSLRLDALEAPEANQDWAEANQVMGVIPAEALLTPGQTGSTAQASLVVTNSSPVYQMGVLLFLEFDYLFRWEGTVGQTAEISLFQESTGAPGAVVPALGVLFENPKTHGMLAIAGSPFINRDSEHFTEVMYVTVPPGGQHAVGARASIRYNGGDLATGVRVTGLQCKISVLGVAVR